MYFSINVTWILFFTTAFTSVLCDILPDVFKGELPSQNNCVDQSRACSLGLKCKGGVTLDMPLPRLTGGPGPRGPQGLPGPRGPPGPMGAVGMAGFPGKDGMNGLPGIRGQPGSQGELGFPGETGAPGMRGEVGQYGRPGIRGEKGEVGVVGPPGVTGPQGYPGPRGEVGYPGEIGPDGPAGDAGVPGEFGLQGNPGEPGPPGSPGKSSECRIAFYAGLEGEKKYDSIASDIPLVLDNVVTNEGGAFFPQNGSFVAPCNGVYAFFVTVVAQTGTVAAVTVQHNAKPVGTVYANSRSKWGSARNSYILSLDAGGEVTFLVAKKAPNLQGDMYTSVSGSCLWCDESDELDKPDKSEFNYNDEFAKILPYLGR